MRGCICSYKTCVSACCSIIDRAIPEVCPTEFDTDVSRAIPDRYHLDFNSLDCPHTHNKVVWEHQIIQEVLYVLSVMLSSSFIFWLAKNWKTAYIASFAISRALLNCHLSFHAIENSRFPLFGMKRASMMRWVIFGMLNLELVQFEFWLAGLETENRQPRIDDCWFEPNLNW